MNQRGPGITTGREGIEMVEPAAVARELASLLGVLSHPHRIRIAEALGNGEMHVNGLQDCLGISHSGVSQHLSLLRAHRLVQERREGRHIYYHLCQPELAHWLLDGVRFVPADLEHPAPNGSLPFRTLPTEGVSP